MNEGSILRKLKMQAAFDLYIFLHYYHIQSTFCVHDNAIWRKMEPLIAVSRLCWVSALVTTLSLKNGYKKCKYNMHMTCKIGRREAPTQADRM